jgi:hypothetical protein
VDELVTKVKEMLVYETVKKALAYVASLFLPAGAFIKAAQAIYAGLRFLMDNIDRIAEVVDAFLSSVELAVRGQVDGIAKRIVAALRGAIVLAIDFLAKLLRLGKLDEKARKILGAIRRPVERAIEAVLRRLKPLVLRLLGRTKKKKKKEKAGARQLSSGELVPQIVKLMSMPTKAAAPAAALAEKRAQAKKLVKEFQPRLKKGKLRIVITDPNPTEVEKDAAVDFDVSASPGTKGEAPVPGADGKVEGLLELKRDFKVEGEAHSLSLTPEGSSVTAVVAPTPVHVGNWVNTRQKELKDANQFDAAKQAADAGIRKTLTDLGKLTYDPKVAPTEEHERAANKLLDALVGHVKVIGFSVTAGVPVPRMVVTPGFSSQMAANTTVKFLFNDPNNHRPGKGTSGREKLHGAYDVLKGFGIARDFWPAAHMLHSKFGGLPVNSNLIPMPDRVNKLQIAFDDKVESDFYVPKKPIWMRFTVERNHKEDDNKLFVSSFKAEAAEMPLRDDKYEVPSSPTLTFDKGSSDMIYPSGEVPEAGETDLTINGLIRARNKKQKSVREVAKATQVQQSVLEDLIDRGIELTDVGEIRKFIEDNPNYNDLTKKRYLTRFEIIKSRIRL